MGEVEGLFLLLLEPRLERLVLLSRLRRPLDLALLLENLRKLPKHKALFKMLERISGLKLKAKKCVLVPLATRWYKLSSCVPELTSECLEYFVGKLTGRWYCHNIFVKAQL